MSTMLPFFLDYDFDRQRRPLIDQQFALSLTPEDLLMTLGGVPLQGPVTASVCPSRQRPGGSVVGGGDYYRPWRNMAAALRDVGSSIKADKDKFQVNLDVQHFAPDDITVKTVDGYIIVEGKHEEKKDEHGYVSRQFTRRYALPVGCDPDTVESRLSSDGVLTVVAPRKAPEVVKGERAVPISQTGPIRREVRDQSPPQTEN